MKTVRIHSIPIGNNNPLILIAGPCVIESEKGTLAIAESLQSICAECDIPIIFKASYEKNNRSDADGYPGPGLQKGLAILRKVKDTFNIPVLSDVHRENDVEEASECLDIIQIPAFLCQQTSLLQKAGSCNKPVNIKKGQFLSPENMSGPVTKVRSGGNDQILLTERGTSFGYNRLVSDICSIPIMQRIGYPVIFDATHITRLYGIPSSHREGGMPQFVEYLARSGVAAGCDGLFIETHPNPPEALCDAASMLPLDNLKSLLRIVLPISRIVRQRNQESDR